MSAFFFYEVAGGDCTDGDQISAKIVGKFDNFHIGGNQSQFLT